MSRIVSSSFRLNLMVLKLIGLFPSRKHPTLHKAYAVSLFVLLMTLPFLSGILYFAFAENLANITYNDYILVAVIFHTFKFLLFLKNRDEIKRCVEYFDDYVVISSDERLIVDECVSTCKRNTSVFLSGCFVTLFVFFGQILLQGKMENLPLSLWLPNVWRETPPIHRCVYFLLILALAYATAATSSIDPLIGGLSHHASAQLRILGHCLQFLDEDENISRKLGIYKKIKKCIQRYQHIVTFVDIYQECFSPIVFSQFMSSVLATGLCCFQIVTMKVNFASLLPVLSIGVIFSQVLFYCYYGTLLVEESNSLFRAVYMSKWYEYDEQSKKALLVFMERLNKPLVVTAGKIFALSLETFTLILQRSYSFTAVLKNY